MLYTEVVKLFFSSLCLFSFSSKSFTLTCILNYLARDYQEITLTLVSIKNRTLDERVLEFPSALGNCVCVWFTMYLQSIKKETIFYLIGLNVNLGTKGIEFFHSVFQEFKVIIFAFLQSLSRSEEKVSMMSHKRSSITQKPLKSKVYRLI